MSPDATTSDQTTPPVNEWPPLPLVERRILGVLVEKQKTSKTADSYPLTLNALVTGCNQKSNREPVTDLDEIEVEEGLTALQKKGLIERVTGGRAERYRHKLYELWTRSGPELAVLAELMLRGAQTKGDLRGRAGRMDAIDTLDSLDAILKSLSARRLVVFLGDPDRRGALVTHGFLTPDEHNGLKLQSPVPPENERAAIIGAGAKLTSSNEMLDETRAEIDDLKARVSELEEIVSAMRRQLGPA